MNKTIAALIGLALGPASLILMDILLSGQLEPDSLSETLRSGTRGTAFVSWPVAVLLGHWYHPIDGFKPVIRTPWNYITLAIVTVVVLTGGYLLYAAGHPVPGWIVVIAGLIVGSILWPV